MNICVCPDHPRPCTKNAEQPLQYIYIYMCVCMCREDIPNARCSRLAKWRVAVDLNRCGLDCGGYFIQQDSRYDHDSWQIMDNNPNNTRKFTFCVDNTYTSTAAQHNSRAEKYTSRLDGQQGWRSGGADEAGKGSR
jgi:hypothetical protein